MSDTSILMANLSRGVDQVNSPEAEYNALAQKMGLIDEDGKDQTPDAIEERSQGHSATAERIQKIYDQSAAAPKAQAPSTPAAPQGTAVDPTPFSGGMADLKAIGSDIAKGAGKVADFVGAAATGAKNIVAEQLVEHKNPNDYLGPQIVGGVASAVQSMTNLGIDIGSWVNEKLGTGAGKLPHTTFADEYFPKSDLASAKLARGAAQFLTAFAGPAKIMSGVKGGALAAEAAAGFLGFEGGEKNLSNLVQSNPDWANPVTEYLMAKPTDSEAEGRLKNAIEFAGLGVLTEGVMKGIKFIKGQKTAQEALQIHADLEAGKTTPEAVASKYTAADIPPVSGTPAPVEGKIDPNIQQQAKMSAAEMAASNTGAKPTPEQLLANKVDPIKLNLNEGGIHINYDKIKTTDDVKQVIASYAESNKEAVAQFRGGATADAELEALAKESGVSKEDLLNRRGDSALNTNELTASRMFLNSAAEKFNTAVTKAVTERTPEAQQAFMQAMDEFEKIHYVVTSAKTEKGRSLHSLSVPVGSAEEQAAYIKQNIDLLGGEKDVQKMADMMSQSPLERKNQAIIKSRVKRGFDAVFESFVNNLFTGKTQVVNFASNWATADSAAIERSIAPFFKSGKEIDPLVIKDAFARRAELMKLDKSEMSFADRLHHESDLAKQNDIIKTALNSGIVRGEATTMVEQQGKAMANEILASYNSVMETIAAVHRSVRDVDGKSLVELIKGQPSTDPFTKLEGLGQAITSENLGGGAFTDVLGGLVRMNSKGLEWADDLWKAVNYRMEVHSNAYRLGVKQGLEGSELDAFVKDFATNPPDFISSPGEPGKINTEGSAVAAARKRTFTNALPADWQSAKEGGFFDQISFLVDKAAKLELYDAQPLRFLIPFTRTPLNISKYAVQRTPLAMLSNEYAAAMAKGGSEAQLAKAQVAFGTTILGAVTLTTGIGYANGKEIFTGAGPRDPNERKLKEATGWRPYSLHIGDRYIPVDKLEPFGSIISMATDIANIGYSSGKAAIGIGDDDLKQLGGLLAVSMMKHMTPEMVMDNMGKLFDAIQSGDPSKITADVSGKVVPLSGYAGMVRNSADNLKRSTISSKDDPFPWLQQVINNIKNQIPGLSSTLPAQQNIWGEDVENPRGIVSDLVSPFIGTTGKKDDLTAELIRLGYAGSQIRQKAPDGETHLEIKMPERTLTMEHGTANLDPVQYHKYVQLSAGHGLKGVDKPLKEALAELVKSNYPMLTGPLKTDQNKRVVISKMVSEYRKRAQAQMLKENPEIESKMGQSQLNYMKARGVR